MTRVNRPLLGNQLVRAANLTRELRDLVDAINDAAQHMVNGADYSMFESQFGITTGQGANTVTLLGLIQTILNTTTDVTGTTRMSQLDEFVSRLAGQ